MARPATRRSCPEAGPGRELDAEYAEEKQREREEERPDPHDASTTWGIATSREPLPTATQGEIRGSIRCPSPIPPSPAAFTSRIFRNFDSSDVRVSLPPNIAGG